MRESELNLIPVDIIEHEFLKERIKFWISLAVVSLLFLLIVNILIKIENNYISRDITSLESTSKNLSREMEGFKQLNMREKTLLKIRDKVDYLSQKGPMIEIFTAIDKAINDNITLTHLDAKYDFPNISIEDKGESVKKDYFNGNAPVKTLKGQMIEGDIVIIRGVAQSNSDLASMLTQLSMQPIFKAVGLKYSRSGALETGKTILFEIECRTLSLPGLLAFGRNGYSEGEGKRVIR